MNHEAERAALDAGTHEPAVDDFGNQYLAPVIAPPLDLARLSELAERATPGPWRRDPHDDYIVGPDGENIHWDHDGLGATWGKDADAAFIAAFDPTTAKALLSEIARLRAALDRLVKAWDMGVDPDASKWKALDREINAALEQARETLSLAATEPAEREARDAD